jgi:hypothetical protein
MYSLFQTSVASVVQPSDDAFQIVLQAHCRGTERGDQCHLERRAGCTIYRGCIYVIDVIYVCISIY